MAKNILLSDIILSGNIFFYFDTCFSFPPFQTKNKIFSQCFGVNRYNFLV